MNYKLVLNVKPLTDKAIEAGKVKSLHAAGQLSGISWPTVSNWNQADPGIKRISLEALPQYLIKGLGMTEAQVNDLKICDLFELISEGNADA